MNESDRFAQADQHVTPLTAGIGIQTSLAWPIFLGKRTRPHSGRGQARLRGRRTTLTTSNVFDYALARHHNDRWRRRHRTWAGHPHPVCVSHTKAVIRRYVIWSKWLPSGGGS